MSDINWGLIRNGYTFQDLICSLIRLEDHKARLYVRPGKDYAQDARSGDGRIIYQMKFHRNDTASSAIADAKEEGKNIAKYLATPGKPQEIWQGVQEWILISNVAFNPNDELKWNQEVKPLFDDLGLKASYWEKSVIETLLLKYPDLKQAYFGGETRVFLGIAEAREQVQKSQVFEHPHALEAPFQGRETELEQYKNFINDAKKKILVIHGPGGIGKTRFLLEGAETEALPEGCQVLWANIATMTATSSWFIGLIVERPTLLLIDEPEDASVLKTLVEQISAGRTKTWKVAVAIRSPNDPVLKYLQAARMQHIVEDLPLTSLKENAAIAFCRELLELSFLQSQTTDWKTQAATWIAQHYDYYPIWMAIAIKLLESTGNLEAMPQEAENLASDYLEGILTQQQSIPSEKALNLLQWTALFDTVNREDTTVIHFIQAKLGCKNPTEIQRYFDNLIARKVIFERGSRNRLLKIKPDVLADYILRQWLTYSRPSGANLEASSEALEIIEEVNVMLDSAEASSIQKLLLRGIARFELLQQLSNNQINLLGRLLHNWYNRVPTMNACRKLAYLSVLNEISFAHVSEVLSLLTVVLHSNSAPETVSTIFGERIITHDDVILALPWIIYHTAPYAQAQSEQMAILSLLCNLVIVERDVATRRPQGLPNDGKRAESVLPRVIKGSPEFRSDFEGSAFEKANELLRNIRSQGISEDQTLILDTLVKPLLDIEQEYTSFDGRFIKTQTWLITPETTKWKIRVSLRTTIKEILRERKLHPTQSVIFWQLLAYAHREINQALLELSRDSSLTTPYYQALRNVIVEDLQWMVEFLKLDNFDIEELAAAREVWEWYAQFSKDNELKEIADQCETSFKERELFPKYAPLFTWESYEVLEQWGTEIANELVNSDNPQIIHDFVRNGVKVLGNPNEVSRLFIVAEKLGLKAQQSQFLHNFVQETLKLPLKDPEFQFTTMLCNAWVWNSRQNDSSAVTALLEQLLQWANTSEKIVHLIQAIYESAWLAKVTEPEAAIVLKQQKHFLQNNSDVSFVGLLSSIFFSNPKQIKDTIETILNNLDYKQLSYGIETLLKPLSYAMRSAVQNIEREVARSLMNWILDQVLRLPDIDDLSGTSIWYIQEFLKMFGKPDLQWLVRAIEKRIQMFLESDNSRIRMLPSRKRLSQWIAPISPDQANDTIIQNLVAKLLSYADSSPMLGYRFPQYLADIDPTGAITADLVVEKLTNLKSRGNLSEIWQWTNFAGYYPDDSSAWRKIAHEACSLAVQFDERHKYLIFHALTNPEPKMWMANIGEIPPVFEKAVEAAKKQLKAETDPVLIPFRQWMLQLAEAELNDEIQRVKEEIEK